MRSVMLLAVSLLVLATRPLAMADDMFQEVVTLSQDGGSGTEFRFDQLAAGVMDMPIGARIHLNFGPGYVAELDRRDQMTLGARIWVGHIDGGDGDGQVLLSELNGQTFGRIRTDDGVWHIIPDGTGHRIFQHGDNAIPEGWGDDAILPEETELLSAIPIAGDNGSVSGSTVGVGSNGTLDLMVLYTPSMVVTWGAAVGGRIQYLVALLDQALVVSDTGMRADLVLMLPLNASETATNLQTLNDLQDGAALGQPSDNVPGGAGQDFSGLMAIRDAVGADLVSIIRRHYSGSGSVERPGSNCGVAFVPGGTDDSIDAVDRINGVAVVSDFINGNDTDLSDGYSVCFDQTFAHEIGHNIGFEHNLEDSDLAAGVRDFAHGHRVDCRFMTIMSYGSESQSIQCPGSGLNETILTLFSNPDLPNCTFLPPFLPCGSADPQDPADNARAAREEGYKVTEFSDAVQALASSVLPTTRTVQTGLAASAFAMVINPQSTGSTAQNCGLRLAGSDANTFSYQTTDMNNLVTGTPNTPVDLAAGEQQSFVFTVTSQTDFGDNSNQVGAVPTGNVEADLFIEAYCENRRTAPYRLGLNTLSFRSTADAPTDIIALAATPAAHPGYVIVPRIGNRVGVFAVAIANVGVHGEVTVTADTGTQTLEVSEVEICQTDPVTGACQSARDNSQVLTIPGNSTATFGVFVRGTGEAVANTPAVNRVFIRFAVGGQPVGATSVAVRTP